MTNTAETSVRFWTRMGELFGRKWFDEYGSTCPLSWCELLDRYTPKELKAGLDLLRNRKSEFPPTLPEVSQILDAARSRMSNIGNDPAELRRGFWRSYIISAVGRGLGHSSNDFERVLVENRTSLGQSMAQLLDEVVDSEIRTGQRTKGHEDMVSERCRRLVVAFNALKAARC